jgi:pimeloyl-ACP methyl ester carboxylesterase
MASLAERDGSAPIAETMTGKMLGKTALDTNPDLVERVKTIIRANTGTGIAGAQRAMAARPDSAPLLSGSDLPALALVGEEDELTPPAEAEKIADLLPQGRAVVVPRAGHLSNMENPDVFNAHVREFLNSLEE